MKHEQDPKKIEFTDMSTPPDPMLFDEKTGATIRGPGPKPLGTKDTVPGEAPRFSVITEAMSVLRNLADQRYQQQQERRHIIQQNTRRQNNEIAEIIAPFANEGTIFASDPEQAERENEEKMKRYLWMQNMGA